MWFQVCQRQTALHVAATLGLCKGHALAQMTVHPTASLQSQAAKRVATACDGVLALVLAVMYSMLLAEVVTEQVTYHMPMPCPHTLMHSMCSALFAMHLLR